MSGDSESSAAVHPILSIPDHLLHSGVLLLGCLTHVEPPCKSP